MTKAMPIALSMRKDAVRGLVAYSKALEESQSKMFRKLMFSGLCGEVAAATKAYRLSISNGESLSGAKPRAARKRLDAAIAFMRAYTAAYIGELAEEGNTEPAEIERELVSV